MEGLHIELWLLPASVPIRPAGVTAANPREGGKPPREGLKDSESRSLVYEKIIVLFWENFDGISKAWHREQDVVVVFTCMYSTNTLLRNGHPFSV